MTTRQSKQISNLKRQLEKVGWQIVEERIASFEGTPRWELQDDIPNLIVTWKILRNKRVEPTIIDFIACWDEISYETFTNDCAQCEVRGTSIKLYFKKDKSLKTPRNKEIWENELADFVELLNKEESRRLAIDSF
jgi:hypothetical protein